MSKIEVNAIEPQCGTDLTVGASGDTITFPTGTTIVNNGTQTGFGRTGTVDWDTTPKTATFSAVSGNGYFCNTTSSAFTVNLPAGVAGAIVSLADYAATWQTYNVTVTPNGTDKIGSVNADVTLNTEGQSVTFVYVDGTQGWVNVQDSTSNERGQSFVEATVSGACNTLVTAPCCANTKIATFTGPGNFTVTNAATCAANNVVSYMVVAGGGGGGAGNGGSYGAGGGGAGGFRELVSPTAPYTASPLDGYPNAPNRITVTATTYPIIVGGGGAGSTASGTTPGVSGNVSTFSSITSAGGGGGGAGAGPGSNGVNGGSGGGAGSNCSSPRSGGTGNTPPVSPPQGNNGGDSGTNDQPAAGGGGATAVGSNAVPGLNNPQSGGAGATTSISASSITYSIGGASGNNPGGPSTAGSNNTGTGGQGAGGNTDVTGANGGSGIVVIRYKFQ